MPTVALSPYSTSFYSHCTLMKRRKLRRFGKVVYVVRAAI